MYNIKYKTILGIKQKTCISKIIHSHKLSITFLKLRYVMDNKIQELSKMPLTLGQFNGNQIAGSWVYTAWATHF